jgi:hypothetical protein
VEIQKLACFPEEERVIIIDDWTRYENILWFYPGNHLARAVKTPILKTLSR